MTSSSINIAFDFRDDTPNFPKKDPDAVSPTLRTYHKYLWSKPLPNGQMFMLNATRRAYLHHDSILGEFFLTSDTLNQSYKKPGHNIARFRDLVPEALNRFIEKVYTIGNMIIFPGRQINGYTPNQARGCNGQIRDRFDLTLECIRRHYDHSSSPLGDDLKRYSAFFDLFETFEGYVDFFLLHDLVNDDCSAINFFLPFVDFGHQSTLPDSVDAYRTYLQGATRFIEARSNRIRKYAQG